jgi:uncharacterized protein (DUF2249 family)
MMQTYNLEDIEHAEKYWRIEQTRSGNYELVVPTELNEEVERFMGSKDFEMDIVKEGEDTLRVTLTPKKNKSKKIN